MLHIRLTRTDDGCCTISVRSTLIFSEVHEGEVEALVEALQGTCSEPSVPGPAAMA